MSKAAVTIDPRMRALSFLTAACVVALACSLMVIISRVAQYSDDTDRSVRVFMQEAPRPVAPPARSTPPSPRDATTRTAANAPPTATDLPIDTAMLAHALACFDRLNRDRPADCPREALEEEPGDRARTRRAYDLSPERLSAPIIYPMGVDPPCQRGFSSVRMRDSNAVGVQYCGGWGVTPPPPSRSAEEVCLAGGIGPCRPPEFREEDVVRLDHTE